MRSKAAERDVLASVAVDIYSIMRLAEQRALEVINTSASWQARLSKTTLTSADVRALSAIQATGDRSNNSVASRLGVTKSALMKTLGALLQAGAVVSYVNHVDARLRILEVTALGREVLSRVGLEVANALSAPLSADDTYGLHTIFNRVWVAADAEVEVATKER